MAKMLNTAEPQDTEPEHDALPLKLHEFLPYRLFVLASRISSALADHYEEEFQITRTEWRILAVLGEDADLSAAEVAERTAMDKVAISRAVNKLLDAGLLERKFAAHDKRRSALRMSPAGLNIYQQIVPIAVEYEQNIVQQLSDDERALLRTLLDKLDGVDLGV